MDFGQKLRNLARAADSNSRGGGGGGSGNNNNANINANYNNGRSDHRGGGVGGNVSTDNNHSHHNHRYHPYNNNYDNRRRNYNHNRNNYNHHHHHQYHSYYNNHNQLTQAEEDFYLPKLIQAIPKYNPIPTLPKRGKKRHVAILFLTIDDLPFEHLWRAFFNNYRNYINPRHVDNDKDNKEDTMEDEVKSNDNVTLTLFESSSLMISVLCHAKFPERVRSPWLQQRLLVSNPSSNHHQRHHNKHRHHNSSRHSNHRNNNHTDDRIKYHTRRPEWGSINITRAMIDLLEEALKIGTTRDRSTLSSSTSIPTTSGNTSMSISSSSSSSLVTELNQDERYSTARYIATTFHNQETTNNAATMSEKVPTVDRFIFASESCLPVCTLKEFELALFGPSDDSNGHNYVGNIVNDSHKVSNSRSSEMSKHNNDDDDDVKKEGSSGQDVYEHEHYKGKIANKSWLKAYNKPNNGYARQLQWDAVKKAIPESYIYKADQWIALTRHHGWPIISLIDDAVKSVQQSFVKSDSHYGTSNIKVALWQCFSNVKASDEMYFPTAMALLGMFKNDTDDDGDGGVEKTVIDTQIDKDSNDSSGKEIASKRVTYCDWSENAKNPASFIINRIQDPEYKELKRRILMAREEGCLFARKFTPGSGYNTSLHDTINVSEWTRIIHDARKKGFTAA